MLRIASRGVAVVLSNKCCHLGFFVINRLPAEEDAMAVMCSVPGANFDYLQQNNGAQTRDKYQE